MQAEGFEPNNVSFICILAACTSIAALDDGRDTHSNIVGNGWESDVVVGTAIISMYGKCGSVDDAKAVFVEMPQRNVVSWNAMIAVCAQNQHSNEALQQFGHMQVKGIKPNKITYISVLDACASVAALKEGQEIHAAVLGNRWEADVVVGNALVTMYGKCGGVDDARAMFAKMLCYDVSLWTAVIAACTQNGHNREAIRLFGKMQVKGFVPNKITFICILDACATSVALNEGQDIHASIVGNGWDFDVVIGNALINVYGKCGSLDDARAVFAEMPLWDVVSWSAMISVCAQHGQVLFHKMEDEGLKPDEITLVCILDACASVGALEECLDVHSRVVANNWESDIVVGNALISMFAKFGCLHDARAVFAEMPEHDVISWSSMITTYTQNGYGKKDLQLFCKMQAESIEPDEITFICILDACDSVAALEEGQKIHTGIVGNGWESDVAVGNALVMMYGRCGSLDDAKVVFAQMPWQDVVSWSAMITMCSHNGHYDEALQLFCQIQAESIEPNEVTLIRVLDVCASMAALEEGRDVHSCVIDKGWESDRTVGNALINMYGKCRSLDDARSVFREMPHCNVVSWNSMISVCVYTGHGEEALQLHDGMRAESIQPNGITFAYIVDACANIADLEKGRDSYQCYWQWMGN